MAGPEGSQGKGTGSGGGRDYAFRVYAVDDSDEYRLKDLWLAVWRGKWLIGLCALGAAVLMVALSFLITPVYRSTALVAPTAEPASSGGLASLAAQFAGVSALPGLGLAADSRTAEAIATLQSRAFTEKFIRDHGLLPILYPDEWDSAAKAWRDPDNAPTLWMAYDRFAEIRSIEQQVETGLVEIKVDWTDPRLAAEWAGALIADVNAQMRERAIRDSDQNLGFLRSELEKSSQVPLQATLYSLIEAEMKNSMLANVRQEYAFRMIDPPAVPERKNWPKRIVFAALGLFLGLAAGVIWAVVRATR